jgi:hypothetical protein
MDNFNYIKGKEANPSDNYAYVKNPLLSETEIKGGNKDKIMYIDLINIGQFINFGYKGSDINFNKNFRNLVESLHNHFVDVFTRIKELQSKIS